MGRQYRVRPPSEVIAEINSTDSRHFFFVDDALAVNRPNAKTLFAQMAPLGRRWAGQGPVRLAEDVELLRLMKRSGCVGLLIGFESVQQETRGEMKKLKHLRIDYAEAMRRFHGEGLAVLGAFVFGFDHENAHVFDETLEFSIKNRLDCVELRLLTPLPGTRLYSRLLEEGRLFAPDWWLRGYSADTLLFQPKGMTADKLMEGFVRLNRQSYSAGSVIRRFFGMSPLRRGGLGCSVYAGLNLAFRKRYLQGILVPQPFVHRVESTGVLAAGCEPVKRQ